MAAPAATMTTSSCLRLAHGRAWQRAKHESVAGRLRFVRGFSICGDEPGPRVRSFGRAAGLSLPWLQCAPRAQPGGWLPTQHGFVVRRRKRERGRQGFRKSCAGLGRSRRGVSIACRQYRCEYSRERFSANLFAHHLLGPGLTCGGRAVQEHGAGCFHGCQLEAGHGRQRYAGCRPVRKLDGLCHESAERSAGKHFERTDLFG